MHPPLRATTNTNNAIPLEHHHWCPEIYHNFPGSTTDGKEISKFVVFTFLISNRFGSC